MKEAAASGERARRGDKNQHSANNHNDCLQKPKLADIGIAENQATRYQKIAAIPEDTFETALEESAKKKGVPIKKCDSRE